MGKTVLITGAVRNSGYGIARKFLSEGWTAFITSRDGKNAEKTADTLSKEFCVPCYGLAFSPRDAKQDTERLFSEIEAKGGTLDALVCTAADLGRFMDPLTTDEDRWESVLLTNVMGYFVPAKYAAKQMITSGKAAHGAIVFVGSVNFRDALPQRSAYVTSKGAIYSMTKALAIDFGQYGIRVNCLAPGPIWTDRYDALDAETARRRAEALPIKRVTTIEQMGNVAYFLCTEASGNMTGSTLMLDGGMDCLNGGGY